MPLVKRAWNLLIRNHRGIRDGGTCVSSFKSLSRSSNNAEPSVSDETDAIVEPMSREQQLTPPQSPSTPIRQSHESSSFFGRRRRRQHRHHHRQPNRSRRIEVSEDSVKHVPLCSVALLPFPVRDIDIGTTRDHHR